VRVPRPTTPEADPTAALDALTLLQRLRPWAISNRLPLVTGGALLSIAIFLGVVLGNLRHPEEAVAHTAPPPEAAPAAAAPREPGVLAMVPLTLDIHPWGEVFVDGKAAGVAPPLTQVDVAPGRHHVEVRHGDGAAWQTAVDVSANATAHIAHGFE
jgi:hypothetical protein